MTRRSLLVFIALLSCSFAAAQTPATVKIVVPFPPGGSVDVVARVLGEEIGRSGGPAIVVENRPGASTIIGTQEVARATPDGSTIGAFSNSFLINSAIRTLPYDPMTSFEPICHLVDSPQVLAVSSASSYKALEDLVADARKRPGILTIGALGPATTQHVASEMLKKSAQIDVTFVPYPGGAPAVTALIGEQVNAIVANFVELQPFILAGKLRPMAVFSPARIHSLPDVPTVREKGIDFDIASWTVIMATGKTPKPVVTALIDQFSRAIAVPAVQAKLEQLQLMPVVQCGDSFSAFLQQQKDILGAAVRAAGIKLD